jgi:hypothetical protein
MYLLNAIAAFRAQTMQSTISPNSFQLTSPIPFFTAKKNPSNAKGMAKIVWLNFTKDKKFFKSVDFEPQL